MMSLVYLEKCTSTNDEILKFLDFEKNPNIFLGVYTFNQTFGRGQYHNVWQNFPNQNLAFSLVLKTNLLQIPDSLFNFHTANLMRKFLANMTNVEVEIKWPNDFIIKNKKISGMLIEKKKIKSAEFFVIGIGINVLQESFVNLPKAGSLLTQTDLIFNLREISEALFQYFNHHFTENVSEKDILEMYNFHLFKKNKISVFEENGLRQNGIIRNVDAEGFLEIEFEDDLFRKFYHKEIELLY